MQRSLCLASLLVVACTRGAGSSGASVDASASPESPSAQSFTFNTTPACSDLDACERDCNAGNADTCRRLGDTYRFASDAGKDERRATTYFERACALDNAPACLSAGQMYEYHHGVAEDDAKAANYYKAGCDLGHVPGCVNYAIMLENGRGVPKDVPAALGFYDKGCQSHVHLACERAHMLKGDGGK